MQKYEYGFAVWPEREWNHPKAFFRLCEAANRLRFVEEMTEREFEVFRSELSHMGLSLREVDRRPAVESEVVL